MSHDFKRSLGKGKVGEELLLKHWPELKRLDGYEGDFELPDGTKLELKTDSYPMAKTKNFFIELYSDYEKKTLGGPSQASKHGCTWFAYLFIKDATLFLFKTEDLLSHINRLVDAPLKFIPNRTWVTAGITISRDSLKGIYELKRLK